MIITGLVSKCGPVTDGKGESYVFSNGSPVIAINIEGVNLRPGRDLTELPVAGTMIKAVVQPIFKSASGDKRGGVTHYVTSFKEV